MGFPPKIAAKALVACGRRCSICHDFCGPKMELHHIKQVADGGNDTFDNCIPLCLNCHAEVKAYNPKHPKGRQYTDDELKLHRDSWYNKVALETGTDNNTQVVPLKRIATGKTSAPKRKLIKNEYSSNIDEHFFINEYPQLVSDCQRVKTTIGSYEWKIIRAILSITDYGLAWKKASLSDLLFELGKTMDYIDNEFGNLIRLGYISYEDDEISLQGKAYQIVELAYIVSEKLDPNIYPENLFNDVMEALI